MTISVGNQIPNVTLHVLGDNGMPAPVNSVDVLGKGKVVLFAVPGAFTPGCSLVHLPGYVKNQAALRAKGVDTIACVSVNDPWVMDQWGKSSGAEGIVMLGRWFRSLHGRYGTCYGWFRLRPWITFTALLGSH